MTQETKKGRLGLIAGTLLLISGITHVSQLFVYPHEGHVLAAAAFGLAYFLIGLGILLRRDKRMAWFGTVLPSIGGILGIYRFLYLQANPFSVFHVLIDIIVVPMCWYGTRHCPGKVRNIPKKSNPSD